MIFDDRKQAGQMLAEKLLKFREHDNVIVLALPRGGLPVGYEIAQAIDAKLDVFLVRKLGAPMQPELAMGAISSGGITAMNDDVVKTLHISREKIDSVIEDEKKELKRREQAYRGERPFPALSGSIVILVDDGIATGATMKAAVKAVQTKNPEKLVAAVPTGPKPSCEALQDMTDETVCLSTPEPFQAIGQWYREFSQLSDDDVRDYLDRSEQ